jgi:hypothetical protein
MFTVYSIVHEILYSESTIEAMMKIFVKISFIALIVLLSPAEAEEKNIFIAIRTDIPPVIDGFVDEDSWNTSTVQDIFYQHEPDDGEPATERTELRVLYDDAALYISFICFDSEPDKIVRRLTRRDRRVPSDFVQIAIDSYNDRTTAFVFEVNAAGVKRDYIMLEDGANEDVTWDGIWDAAVATRDDGWSVEMKIPYQTLRFSAAEEQVWGFNASRMIDRKNEFILWSHIPQSSRAVVSRFGILRGLHHLNPPRSLLVLPYALAGATRWPSNQLPKPVNQFDSNLDVGADIQYGVSNRTTLNVTVNPDFGQVELDEVILNLSAFETFYPERRPFFVEGASIFRTVGALGGGLLRTHMFYSRRIGRQPSRYHYIPDSIDTETWYLKNNPAATPILGAVKLSTQSGNGWAGGFLNATTGRTQKILRSPDNEDLKIETETLSNYSVGRVRYDLSNPGSYIGALATSVFRQNGVPQAYSGGVDWNYNTHNYSFVTDGLIATTSRNTKTGKQQGYHAQARIQTMSHEVFQAMIGSNIFSKDFNPNDLGFNTAENVGIYYIWFSLRRLEPLWIIRRINFSQFNYTSNILDTGSRFIRGIEPNLNITWMNYWVTSMGGTFDSKMVDPFESRGMGYYNRPGSNQIWIYTRSDNRKPLTVGAQYSYSERGGAEIARGYELPLTYRAGYHSEIMLNPSYRTSRGTIGWVSNITGILEPDVTTPVFGRRNVDQLNTTLRITHTFNPDLSLQGYIQYFWARGEYYSFYKLEETGDIYDLPVDYNKSVYSNPDFNRSAFNINLILRYEYRSGSTIFLVWTHNKQESLNDYTISAGSFFNRTLDSPSMNILMLKWTYAIGM